MLYSKEMTKKMSTTFLRVKNSMFVAKEGDSETEFDSISGTVTGIQLKEHEHDGEKFRAWHLLMEDRNIKAAYDITFGENSGVFRSIVRALSSDEGLTHLRDIEITVFKSQYGNFTNAIVCSGSKRLSWRPGEMPAASYVRDGDKFVADYTQRLAFVTSLVDLINYAAASDDSYGRCESSEDEEDSSEHGDE